MLIAAAYTLALPPLNMASEPCGTTPHGAEPSIEPDALVAQARAWATKNAKRMVNARAELWSRYCAQHPAVAAEDAGTAKQGVDMAEDNCAVTAACMPPHVSMNAALPLPSFAAHVAKCADMAYCVFERCYPSQINNVLQTTCKRKGCNASMLAQLRERAPATALRTQ